MARETSVMFVLFKPAESSVQSQFVAIVAVAAATVVNIAFAACGTNHPDASVDSLLSDDDALPDEMDWCGKQRNREVVQGCRNAADALAIGG